MWRTARGVEAARRPPSADAFAWFGEGSQIVAPTRVVGAAHMSIGRETTVRAHSFLLAQGARGTGSLLRIGDRVQLGRSVVINATTSVDIGDDVRVADGVAIIDSWGPLQGPRAATAPPPPAKPVVIEAGAHLSARCIIGPGVRVGRGAYIGEGAVVTDDVPAGGAVRGNPPSLARRADPEPVSPSGTGSGVRPPPAADGTGHEAADEVGEGSPFSMRWARRAGMPPGPSAFARFGARSVIIPPSRVWNPGAIAVGSDVIVHENGWMAVLNMVPGWAGLTIGDRVRIGASCRIVCVGPVEIGEEVVIANRVALGATDYVDPAALIISPTVAPRVNVTIGRGACLGIGSMVLPGVTVGEQAYVGAGAVVATDVAPRTLVVGNPAHAIGTFDAATRTWAQVD